MKKLFYNYLIISAVVFSFASCSKDDPIIDPPVEANAGVYILNQGSSPAANSTLTYYDYTTKQTVADVFSSANSGSPLGAIGNDVQIYGSKMYITVNVSSTLEIVNPKTGKLIKHISMVNGNANRQPRYVAFYKNKAYISSYDNTVAVLDTASLQIEKYINVGRNPEQLAVANGKLYVANSGGLDFGNQDKTVSVIDLSSGTVIKTITVPLNPVSVAVDSGGDVYVVSVGNYDNVLPALTIINAASDAVKSSEEINIAYGSQVAIAGNHAYMMTTDNEVMVYNTDSDTKEIDNFVTDGTTFQSPYAIAVDHTTGQVFVADAKNYVSDGVVYVFGANGKQEYSIQTGLIPGRITFLNK